MTYDPRTPAREKTPVFGAFQLHPSHLTTTRPKPTKQARESARAARERAARDARWAAAGATIPKEATP